MGKLNSAGPKYYLNLDTDMHWIRRGTCGTIFLFDITYFYRNILNWKCIIIGLQKNRRNNQEKDPSKCDSMNVKNSPEKLNEYYYTEL